MFDFLHDIFKIASAGIKDNCLIRIKDNAKKIEKFHEWYPQSTEFHLDMIIYNYYYTQISTNKIKRLLKILKYRKRQSVDIQIPDVVYDNKWWKLEEAGSFHDIADDEEEFFAHNHLFALCKD
jgi:hypothetical protein